MTQVSGSVAAAARERIRQAEEERKRVLEAIWAGRPMEAEPDAARKLGRIQAVTGVSRGAAEALARYEDPAALGLAGEALVRAERIQGKTVDFLGVAFLEVARAAAAAVGRVAFRDLQPQGSGLMVSDRLFLTNNHVISGPAEAKQFMVQFNYELDEEGQERPATQFELDPDTFFFTSPEDVLDFTLVAVGGRVSGTATLHDFGYCPLLASDDKHMLGDFVNVIQHPEGAFKQVVIRENRLVTRLDTVLHYVADTMPGSSGSPVFNDEWEVIALHHWGEPYTVATRPDGRPVRRDVNEGVRISAIARALQEGKGNLSGVALALLEAALNPPSRRPSTLGERAPVKSAPAVSPTPVPPGQPAAMAPLVGEDGTVTWTIPLTVSVRLSSVTTPLAAQPVAPAVIGDTTEPETAGEAVKVDRHYDNRGGYDPGFLPGHRLDLPRLSEKQQVHAARKLQVATGENPYELTYQHFSIVMNAERRMAYFTAVNIDGASWVAIKRAVDTSGSAAPEQAEAAEAAEATEVWFDDPRISREAQTDQSLYDKQRPKRLFDRGHMVRRQDPAWGTKAAANRANADTFHFANCAPQEARFNQDAHLWQGIENYVLDNAKADDIRVTVFTGPVFTDDDPDYRYVKVPKSFWKIVARVEHGKLLATALLADQSERITRLPERMSESFDDMSKVQSFQVSVAEVERLSGLDLSPLRDHDTVEVTEAEALSKRRPLSSFRDVALGAPKRQSTGATQGRRRIAGS
jgi:endonuclease G